MKLNPFIVFLHFHTLLSTGKVRFYKNIEPNAIFPDGFSPFLRVQLPTLESESAVRLVVKFKVRRINFWQKFLLPVFSIPFFAGAHGFMDKVFLRNESENTFCGFYTWCSQEDAEYYTISYPGKMMAANALPNSLSMEITPIP